jgi:alpha-L-fucosidase
MPLLNTINSLIFLSCLSLSSIAQNTPKPYGVIPSARQLSWQEKEMYVIMHFTPTTFQNKEWGFGDADPAIFNPTHFNANNIAAAVKAGGFKGITLVAKHHDGFALWPTKSTEYNISKSPFRDGKADLVKEMMLATTKTGLAFGIYCSPWDRNNANYSKPAYINEVFYQQLNELYSNYGQLFTVFYDGANGGDGYYGGAKEKRSIDASTYYNYEKIWTIVREKQPGAAIFSDIGPDVRWVGNESGFAAETSWSTFTPLSPSKDKKPSPGFVIESTLPTGTRDGAYWTPAECDVPLRPGWFYHPEQDGKTKTPAQLLNIYYQSVGRSASLDLGIAPMPNGELHPDDIKSLKEFGAILMKTFATNFAVGAKIQATNIRANSSLYAPEKLIDNDRYSYWATDDSVTHADLVFQLKKKSRFNVIRLRENIKLGQRIEAVAIDIWLNNQWKEIGQATSIGGNRLIHLQEHVETNKVRLRILKSPVCIALSDFGLFEEASLQ